MDGFTASCSAATGASGSLLTIGTLVASTSIRGFIDAISVGITSAPLDDSLRWLLQRFTAAGTAGSAVTPRPADSAAPASLITSGQGFFSVEPTYSSQPILWDEGINGRNSAFSIPFRKPLVIPATSGNGIGAQCADQASNTPTARIVFDYHQ